MVRLQECSAVSAGPRTQRSCCLCVLGSSGHVPITWTWRPPQKALNWLTMGREFPWEDSLSTCGLGWSPSAMLGLRPGEPFLSASFQHPGWGWDMHPSLQGEGRDGLRGPSSTLSQRLRHSEGGKGRLCGWESPESLERCGESTLWGEGSGATGTEAQEELESGRHGAAGSPREVEKPLKKKQNRFETPEKTRKLCIPWFFGG